MNELEDQYRYLVSGYYGMQLMDEYPLKEYVLQDIKDYIKDFVNNYPIKNYNYQEEAMYIKEHTEDRIKLQDLLLVLNKIKADIDIILLVKEKLQKLEKND